MPRGGRRPGAGAPKGNLNGLKHGLRSQGMRRLVEELAGKPALRSALARFARLAAKKQAVLQAEHAAANAVAAWLRYTHALDRGEPWTGPVPPPPFTYRQARIFAKQLAHQAIIQSVVRQTQTPPETHTETSSNHTEPPS
jgi:hypothetical protein